MNVAWPITALYFGIFGLWAYYAFGRQAASSDDGHRQKLNDSHDPKNDSHDPKEG